MKKKILGHEVKAFEPPEWQMKKIKIAEQIARDIQDIKKNVKKINNLMERRWE